MNRPTSDAFRSLLDAHPDVELAFGHAADLLRRARAAGSRDLAYDAGAAFGRLVEMVEAVEGEALDERARSALREIVTEAAWPPRLN